MIQVRRLEPGSALWTALTDFAQHCSWAAGPHLADMLRRNAFTDWESVFAAVEDGEIIGFCTFLKTDYYPENRYWPWISSIFIAEPYRGRHISKLMIERVMDYAKEQGFTRVYIPSDMLGFYEKYGFTRIDVLRNYGGEMDFIFAKDLVP